MRRDEIIARLQAHKHEIEHLDVERLDLFGSAARDEAGATSDIDMLVRFRGRPTFDRFMDLKSLLERVTGRPVDLVTEAAVRPELRSGIDREAIRVA